MPAFYVLKCIEKDVTMNCYDFDKTIYHGDSSCDFYCFCLKRHKKIMRRWPSQALAFVRHYLFHTISKTQMKEVFYRYFCDICDMDAELAAFWQMHLQKIEPYYLKQKQETDVIISASPSFFLKPACQSLGLSHLIASEVDAQTGQYRGENCHGAEKVLRFRALYPQTRVEAFYSDSLSDTPMAELAETAYLVKNGQCSPWPKK